MNKLLESGNHKRSGCKILVLALCFTLMVSMFPSAVLAADEVTESVAWEGTVASDFSGGSGTESDPYQISDAAELAYLAKSVNSGNDYADMFFTLTKNIDLSEANWISIGTEEKMFAGTFDGGDHDISGLSIDSSENNAGLFGVTAQSASISNVKLSEPSISGGENVGSLVGSSYGKIEACEVAGGKISGTSQVGGLVGVTRNKVYSCIVSGIEVEGSGSSVGGVIGCADFNKHLYTYDIESCGIVSSTVNGSNAVGGIVGYKNKGPSAYGYFGVTIKYSYNSDCRITGAEGVGGIVGRSHHYYTGDSITVKECFNSGTVSGETYVGGIVGWASGAMNNGSTTIENCYNNGNVDASEKYAGGICAATSKTIKRCYNIGDIYAPESAAAICGATAVSTLGSTYWATIENCYYLDGTDKNATQLSSEQFKLEESFEGWDFDTVWTLTKTDYPRLKKIFSADNSFDNTKYSAGLDGWCIPNCVEGFGYSDEGYQIPLQRYAETFGINLSTLICKALSYNYKGTFPGNCFGMSLMSIANYNNQIDLSTFFEAGRGNHLSEYGYTTIETIIGSQTGKIGQIFTLKGNEAIVESIERCHISQYSQEFKKAEVFGNDKTYKEVLDYINQNNAKPLLVTIEGDLYAHAVVIDPSKEPVQQDGWYIFSIYDPNTPQNSNMLEEPFWFYNRSSYLALDSQTGKWRYAIEEDDGEIKIEAQNSYVNYLQSLGMRKTIRFYDPSKLEDDYFSKSLSLLGTIFKIQFSASDLKIVSKDKKILFEVKDNEIVGISPECEYTPFYDGGGDDEKRQSGFVEFNSDEIECEVKDGTIIIWNDNYVGSVSTDATVNMGVCSGTKSFHIATANNNHMETIFQSVISQSLYTVEIEGNNLNDIDFTLNADDNIMSVSSLESREKVNVGIENEKGIENFENILISDIEKIDMETKQIFQKNKEYNSISPYQTCYIIPEHGANGKISPSSNVNVVYGASQTFTITPDEGYEVEDVLVDGKSVGAVTSYTFENVTANHTISATFKKKETGSSADSDNNQTVAAAKIKAGVEKTTIKLKSTFSKKNNIQLNWTKSAGYKMDYYQVYRSTKRYSGYGSKAYYQTSTGTKNFYINTKELKKGTRYFYKVRGVRLINGEKVYTQWSNKAWRISRVNR